MPDPAAAALILAAGSSRRLGRPKQLVMLDGRPILQHVVDAATAAGLAPVVVVLGHEAERVRAALGAPPGALFTVNAAHATGQASSLRAGLNALAGTDAARAVVLLGDQPRIPPQAIAAVAAGPGPIRRAVYRGDVPGHPVAVDRELWPRLRGIGGDRGARDLMREHPELVQAVAVDADPPADVDTEDDVRAIGAD